MPTTVYPGFGIKLKLDPAAVCFLSAVYDATKEAGGYFTKTQDEFKELTTCTIYQQRRVRKQLIALDVMKESRKVVFVDGEGYRTRVHFKANVEKLDSLLAEVEAEYDDQYNPLLLLEC